MSEDGSPTAWVAPTVTASDFDTSALSLVWSLKTGPSLGTATVSGNSESPSTFSYTPNTNRIGTDFFVVQVSDGSATDTITVNITINPVNDAPEITGQGTLSTLESVSKTITLGALNVADPDSIFPGSFTLTVGSGSNYTLNGATLTPARDFRGTLSVPVTVNDGEADSNTYNLQVAVNDNPVPSTPVVAGTSPVRSPTWNWNASATGNYRYKLDSSDFSSGYTETSATSYSPSIPPADGPHTIYVQVRNENMEWSAAGSRTIVVDNSQPTASIDTPANGLGIADLTTIAGTSSDTVTSVAIVEVQVVYNTLYLNSTFGWNSTPTWIPVSGTTNWSLDVGVVSWVQNRTYTVRVRATDSVGNVSAYTQSTFTFGVTPSAPVIIQGTALRVMMSENGLQTPWSAPTLTATDADSTVSSLMWSVTSAPSHGTATVSGSGVSPTLFSYTPTSGYSGEDSFVVMVSDGTLSDTITVNVTINPANRAPVLPAIGPKSVDEGATLSFAVIATDPNNDTLNYSATNLPEGATFNQATGTFTWTPTYAQSGSYLIDLTVNDGVLNDSEVVAITVGNVNRPPVLDAIGPRSGQVGTAIQLQLSGTDPDGDALYYLATPALSNALLNPTTSTYTWMPTQAGTYEVVFTISDGIYSDSETVSFTIAPLNHAPVLESIGNIQAEVMVPVTFTLQATDEDWDTLAYSAGNLPAGAILDPVTGFFAWTPTLGDDAKDFNITFIVNDNGLPQLGSSIDVTITVGDNNQPPVLDIIGVGNTINAREGDTVDFTVHATDPDNDTVTYQLGNAPLASDFNPTTGHFTWVTTYGDSGVYHLTVTAEDDGVPVKTDSAQISITIGEVNHPPVLTSIGNRTVDENLTLEITLTANDPDNDALTFGAQNLPTGATLNGQQFAWTPGNNQQGNHEVTFTVTDGLQTNSETITITVGNINRPPVLAIIGPKSVNEGVTLAFTASGNDPDGDALTYTAQNLPTGAVFNASTRGFAWTPTYGQASSYDVTFTATDGLASDSETITITVGNVNRPPVLSPIGPRSGQVGTSIQLQLTATDPDNDSITYSISPTPQTSQPGATEGSFIWVPTAVGSFTFLFTATDGIDSDAEAVTFTIAPAPVNNTPSAGGGGGGCFLEAMWR